MSSCPSQFPYRRYFIHFIVTISSALVGWIATQASKSLFLAPIFTATAKPCSISPVPRPIKCSPTTFSSGPSHTILNSVGFFFASSDGKILYTMAANFVWYILIFSLPYLAMASGSVSPIVPTSGWAKTTVGTLL